MSDNSESVDFLLDDDWDRERDFDPPSRALAPCSDEYFLAQEAIARGAARVVDAPSDIRAVVLQFQQGGISEFAALRFFQKMHEIDSHRRRYVRSTGNRQPLAFALETPWAMWWWTNAAVNALPPNIDRSLIWGLVVHGYERRLLLAVRKLSLIIEPTVVQPGSSLARHMNYMRECLGPLVHRWQQV